jgi:Tfp pilus assembly protein PilO
MKTKNLIVGAVAGVVVLAVWYMFVLSPINSQKSKAHKATTAAEKDLQAAQAQLSHLEDLKARSKQIDAQVAKLRAAVPANPAIATFIRQANQIAAETQVSWQSVAPSQQASVPGTGAVSVGGTTPIGLTISVKGGVHEVLDYLDHLMAIPRVVVIDTVQVSPGNDANSGGLDGGPVGDIFAGHGVPPTLTVQITARMFTTPPATATASTTGSGASTTPTTAATSG